MSGVFSDSWFRVAHMRVGLLPSVKVQQQLFRGKPWYVLQDTYSQRFFRVSPEGWSFISRLTPDKTVEQVWDTFVQEHPHDAPGQEEVLQLLSQLHVSNLLYFAQQPDNVAIFERAEKQRQRELLGRVMAFLYFRVPLWDPDRWLDSIKPFIRFMTGPVMAIAWVILVVMGVSTAIEHREALVDHSQGLLSLSNLPWLYISLAGMKFLHEMGHAFVCKRYGGEVRVFGLMFLLFTPLPYMDATASWSFKRSWQRVYVGAAGMLVEFFLAAIGALVWANTGPGLVNSIAFNVMVIGSVSSLLFNGNPLLRFDAYYMLSDMVEIPNLYQKSQQQWLYFADRWLLGTRTAKSPALDKREWTWLTVYGALSFVYMWIVTIGITLFLLDQWFAIGLIALAITVVTKIGMPLYKLFSHLTGAKAQRNRRRALGVASGIAAAVLAFGAFVPLPYSVKAHGILEAQQSSILYAKTDGALVKVDVRNGDRLHGEEVIAQLRNPELEQDLQVTEEALKEAEVQLRQAMFKTPGDLAPIERRIQSLTERQTDLIKQKQQLTVRAPHEGEWVAPMLHEFEGAWIQRGQTLGEMVDRRRFRVVAVVPQEQADELFRFRQEGAELRLVGQAEIPVTLGQFNVIPYQRQKLSSAALGWMGGGDIAVKTDEKSGQMAMESFYALYADLPQQLPAGFVALHGMTGMLRISLPWQPAFWQLEKAFMQLVQKRYGL